MEKTLRIVCETPGCKNCEQEINAVVFDEGPEQDGLIELFIENFGTGAEDPEDYCPICKGLGVLGDSES